MKHYKYIRAVLCLFSLYHLSLPCLAEVIPIVPMNNECHMNIYQYILGEDVDVSHRENALFENNYSVNTISGYVQNDGNHNKEEFDIELGSVKLKWQQPSHSLETFILTVVLNEEPDLAKFKLNNLFNAIKFDTTKGYIKYSKPKDSDAFFMSTKFKNKVIWQLPLELNGSGEVDIFIPEGGFIPLRSKWEEKASNTEQGILSVTLSFAEKKDSKDINKFFKHTKYLEKYSDKGAYNGNYDECLLPSFFYQDFMEVPREVTAVYVQHQGGPTGKVCRTYLEYDIRFKSYTDEFTHYNITADEFAKAGFYYKGFKDLVECAECGLMLSNWMGSEVPLWEHLTFSPECKYLKKLKSPSAKYNFSMFAPSVDQIPIIPTSDISPNLNASDKLEIAGGGVVYYDDDTDSNRGIVTQRHICPNKAILVDRINTFNNECNTLVAEILAKRGLYYSNRRLYCYSCGRYNNWNEERNGSAQFSHDKNCHHATFN